MSRSYRDKNSGSWEKHYRKFSNNKIRVSEREFCTRAKIDDEAPLSYDIVQKEPIWGDYWTGYWRPIRRWLNSHVGEPWNQVNSLLVAKLKEVACNDDRENKYLIRSVVDFNPDPSREYSCFRWEFYVDDNGILRRRTRLPKKKIQKINLRELTNWLGGRVIGKVGDKFFWFTQVTKPKKYRSGTYPDKWMCRWSWRYYGLEYLYLDKEKIMDKEGNFVEMRETWKHSSGAFLRQARKLTSKELAYWNKVPKYYQDKVLEWSPTYNGKREAQSWW